MGGLLAVTLDDVIGDLVDQHPLKGITLGKKLQKEFRIGATFSGGLMPDHVIRDQMQGLQLVRGSDLDKRLNIFRGYFGGCLVHSSHLHILILF